MSLGATLDTNVLMLLCLGNSGVSTNLQSQVGGTCCSAPLLAKLLIFKRFSFIESYSVVVVTHADESRGSIAFIRVCLCVCR